MRRWGEQQQESQSPQCSDGIDNDGDGLVDFPDDPGCIGPNDDSEDSLPSLGYGDYTAAGNLGHALAVLEALIGQLYLVTVVAVVVTRLGRPARKTLAGGDVHQSDPEA